MPEPTPEAWALIRHAYEHTDKPLAHICAENDITIPMPRYRMKKWDWTRRKPFVPQQGPEKVMAETIADLHPPLEGEGRRAASEARCEPGWGDARVQQFHPTPPAFAPAPAGDPPPPGEGNEGDIIPRLQSAVARVLPAIEATITRLSTGPQHPREMEQAGRTLSSLTRTLRELNGLLEQHKADAPPEPVNIDELRAELAQRLRGIIEARRAARGEKT